MSRWVAAFGIVLLCLQVPSADAQEPPPDFLEHSLGILESDWVRPDPSNNGTPITFFGIGDLDLRCRASASFMTLAEAVSMASIFYAYAENAFLGDLSSRRPGYAIEHDVDNPAPIGAIDLLKRIDPASVSGLIQATMDRLEGRQRELAFAGLAAMLGRYQPTIERLDQIGDDLPSLVQQLDIPSYDYNVLSAFGLPQDGDPCFSSFFYFNVRIGERESYVSIRSMDHYLDSFWVRRYADGSYRLIHSLLLEAQAALQLKP
ncbi:MAG: hypothetical protein AAFX92_06835 [Pseudomonadota bacterium]